MSKTNPAVNTHISTSSQNREIGNDALVVENLTKTIDGVKVLDNISFLMKPTDKIAFVGPNTLAATTLFKILSGEMDLILVLTNGE